jgi:hypothetical protein
MFFFAQFRLTDYPPQLFFMIFVHDISTLKCSLSIVSLVWGYSTLAITIISLSSLLVIAIIPLLGKSFYNKIMSFLVALAIGCLTGDALLHLIPHVSMCIVYWWARYCDFRIDIIDTDIENDNTNTMYNFAVHFEAQSTLSIPFNYSGHIYIYIYFTSGKILPRRISQSLMILACEVDGILHFWQRKQVRSMINSWDILHLT